MNSIRMINKPTYVPSWMLDDGALFFDMPEEHEFSFSKLMEELTDLAKIKAEASLSFSLDYTKRNDFILERFKAPLLNGNFEGIDIEAKSGAVTLPAKKLRMIGFDDSTQTYEVELYDGHWIDLIKELRFRDIDLGTFTFTAANVLASWAIHDDFQVFPLIHYGAFRYPGEVDREDLRVHFNVGKLLKKAFCAVGWNYENSFLDGAAGSHLITYISGDDWFTYADKNHANRVECNVASPQSLGGAISIFTLDEVSDPFDLYNNLATGASRYFFSSSLPDGTRMRIKGFMEVELTAPPNPTDPTGKAYFLLVKEAPGASAFVEVVDYQIKRSKAYGEITETYRFEFDYIDEESQSTGLYSVWMGHGDLDSGSTNTPYPFRVVGGEVSFIPDVPFYVKDDTIELNELCDPDVTALAVLKGISHYMGGKFETDYLTRTVKHLPPFDTDIGGEIIEGFFLRGEAPLDWSDKVLVGSRKAKVKTSDRNRRLELGWKKATGAYVKQQLSFEPYSRIVDFGEGKDDKTVSRNPFFEPSIEILTTGDEVASGAPDTPYIPAFWDNTDGDISNDIKPRILYNYGLIIQRAANGNNTEIIFEGNDRSSFCYATMVPRSEVVSNDPFHLAYGYYQTDAWTAFLERITKENFSGLENELLFTLNEEDYLSYNFRRLVSFFYGEQTIKVQPTEIKDFIFNRRISTPVTSQEIQC